MKNEISQILGDIRTGMILQFPCQVVPRKKIAEATGGILQPGTVANDDSQGIGIEEQIKIGRQVCYRVDKILEYIEKRIGAA